jgi:hypothetical protein
MGPVYARSWTRNGAPAALKSKLRHNKTLKHLFAQQWFMNWAAPNPKWTRSSVKPMSWGSFCRMNLEATQSKHLMVTIVLLPCLVYPTKLPSYRIAGLLAASD